MTGRRSGRRTVLALLSAGLLLAGCGGLPTDATVRSPDSVEAGPAEGRVLFLPPPPSEGDSPEEIVEGFLLAQGGDDPDHGVARQYLTTRAASTWDDDAGVVVFEEDPVLEEVDVPADAGARLSLDVAVPVTAEIAPDGAYRPVDRLASEEFELVRIAEEWRLDRVPDGLWLPRRTAGLVLTRVLPHFLAPLEPHVVPDPRYLAQAQDLPDRLVGLVLAGPSSRLAPAVGTAAEDVQLRVPVAVEDGTATVDLAGFDALTEEEQDALAAQLAWTLLDSPAQVDAVRVLASGQRVPLGPQDSTAPLERTSPLVADSDPDVLPRSDDLLLLAVDGTQLRTYRGRGSGARGEVPLDEAVRYPALPLEGNTVAALDGTVGDARTAGRLVTTTLEGGPVETLLEAPSLSRPAFDPVTGEVWTVRSSGADATGTQRVVLIDPESREVRPVEADELLDQGDVLLVRPSRDGSRVAALVRAAGEDGQPVTRVVVAPVLRGSGVGEDERSVTVEAVRDLSATAADVPSGVLDVAWAGADRLAILASSAPLLPAQPLLVPIEGADALELPSDRPLAGPRTGIAAATSDDNGAELVVEVSSPVGNLLFRGGRGDVFSQVGPGQDPTFRG